MSAPGRPGTLKANPGGSKFFLPYRQEGIRLVQGTADALRQNMDYLTRYDPEQILILSGDHIYYMTIRHDKPP